MLVNCIQGISVPQTLEDKVLVRVINSQMSIAFYAKFTLFKIQITTINAIKNLEINELKSEQCFLNICKNY
jgi:hypothetical protein